MRLAGWSDSTWCTSFGQLSKPYSRQRVLRRSELHCRIGDAQRVEVFSGLLAQLFERRAFPQMTGGRERHGDLLSDIARVRSTG
jgi:hypothetical protein